VSFPSFIMILVNAIALLALLYTSERIHADMTTAVIYAFLMLTFCATILHNICRTVYRNRARLRKREINGF